MNNQEVRQPKIDLACDPYDCSKPFGFHLDNLLGSIFELEQSDFEECLYNGNFDCLTPQELKILQGWVKDFTQGNAEEMPRETLLKTNHSWAVASVLWAMVADGD